MASLFLILYNIKLPNITPMACIYELNYSDEIIGKAIDSLEEGTLSLSDKIKF